jgi:hypothetical protein
MWPLALEAAGSLVWVVLAALAFTLVVFDLLTDTDIPYVRLGVAWGVAISVVATVQLAFAIGVERRYDPTAVRAFLLGPLYPLGYWAISAAAAVRSEVPALFRGRADEHVGWDLPRERLRDPGSPKE